MLQKITCGGHQYCQCCVNVIVTVTIVLPTLIYRYCTQAVFKKKTFCEMYVNAVIYSNKIVPLQKYELKLQEYNAKFVAGPTLKCTVFNTGLL